eukprot:Em0030g13a
MSVTGETVECDASASKYSYSAIFEYVTNALYPSDVSKEYKRGLRKRAAFFSVEAGHLYYSRRILEQGGLLDDFVIYAVLMLLRDQFPTMSGFQPTVLCQVKGFTPMNTDGIQIHYTDEEHWVTTALSDGSVFLYDSLVVYGSICGASFVLIAGTVVFTVTYVKCKPKEDSNIRGMDTHPNSVHSASLAVCFLSSAASDDAPAVAPTADKPFEFGGETTQISKAAGFRPSQSVISAGPDWDRSVLTPHLLKSTYYMKF